MQEACSVTSLEKGTTMKFEQLRAATTYKLVDFDKAEVIGGFVNDTYFLSVSGHVPCFNMHVRLNPLIYIREPEYWGIEVTGWVPDGICLEAIRPYHLTGPLSSIGTRGIEVIGGNRSLKIDVPHHVVELSKARLEIA